MGADSFFGLPRWHRAAEIPFVAPLIVAARPGQPLDSLQAALPLGLSFESEFSEEQPLAGVALRTCLLRNPAGETAPFYLLPGLHVEISASEIREQVQAAATSPLAEHKLLPNAVFEMIRARGLYRS
jgi:nicotinic acid mononucleotide adenylyltransferase